MSIELTPKQAIEELESMQRQYIPNDPNKGFGPIIRALKPLLNQPQVAPELNAALGKYRGPFKYEYEYICDRDDEVVATPYSHPVSGDKEDKHIMGVFLADCLNKAMEEKE